MSVCLWSYEFMYMCVCVNTWRVFGRTYITVRVHVFNHLSHINPCWCLYIYSAVYGARGLTRSLGLGSDVHRMRLEATHVLRPAVVPPAGTPLLPSYTVVDVRVRKDFSVRSKMLTTLTVMVMTTQCREARVQERNGRSQRSLRHFFWPSEWICLLQPTVRDLLTDDPVGNILYWSRRMRHEGHFETLLIWAILGRNSIWYIWPIMRDVSWQYWKPEHCLDVMKCLLMVVMLDENIGLER